jgi:putative tricarboxylic transport membrane protein
MHRRQFIASFAAGCLPLTVAQGQVPDAAGVGGRLTLFSPAPEDTGWSVLAQAIASSVREADIEPVLVYEPHGAVSGLRRFLHDYAGRGDALMTSGTSLIVRALRARFSADFDDLIPVARLTSEYLAVAVRPEQPYHSLAELLNALAPAPSGVQFCGGNIGTMDHLLASMIARRTRFGERQLRYRPYRGNIAPIEATLRGSEMLVIAGLSQLQPHLALGQLRAIAVSAPQRLPGSGVPTFLEQGLNIELSNWRGVFAPPGLDPAEVRRLIALTDQIVAGTDWKATLFRYNWIGAYLPGAAFGAFLHEETARLRTLLNELGM